MPTWPSRRLRATHDTAAHERRLPKNAQAQNARGCDVPEPSDGRGHMAGSDGHLISTAGPGRIPDAYFIPDTGMVTLRACDHVPNQGLMEDA